MLNYYVIIALNSPVFQLRFGWRNHYVDDPKMLDFIKESCSDDTFTHIIQMNLHTLVPCNLVVSPVTKGDSDWSW